MAALIDHIVAVIIGATVLFIIAALALRGQDSAVETVQVDAARTGLRLLVDAIEQDVNNMGSGMLTPNAADGNPAHHVVTHFGPEAGYAGVLRFRALPTRGGTADPALITYRWKADGTAALPNGTDAPVLLVERLVNGVPDGASFSNVTVFNVQLRTANQAPFVPASGNYHLVRYVDVDVAMVSPLGADGLIEQTRWARQFRPLNLAAENQTLLRVVL